MKLSAFIFAGILLAVVPAPLVAQYYGAARGGWMIYGRPQYGRNVYLGLLHDNGFQNTGWNGLNHWDDGISGFNMDQSSLHHGGQEFPRVLRGGSAPSGTGRATGGAMRHAMPTYGRIPNVVSTYFDNYNTDVPFPGQGQVKLRQKRSAQYAGEEQFTRSTKGRRRNRRPRPRDQLDAPRHPGNQGFVLGKARSCPKMARGPLRFKIQVPPS